MANFRYAGTPDELSSELDNFRQALAGHAPDDTGCVRRLKMAMARALLAKIQDAFEKKSGGDTDDAGIKWPPLAAATLVLRHIVGTQKRVDRLLQRKLTPAQRALVTEHAQRLHGVVTHSDRAGMRAALRILERKRRLGKVSDSYYNHKKKVLTEGIKNPAKAAAYIAAGSYAQILRDTGRLYRSLTPDLAGTGEQVITDGPGWLEIGSTVPYLPYHQSAAQRRLKKDGTPRLPRRQVFPDALPKSWVDAMMVAVATELAKRDFWAQLLGNRLLG